MLLYHMIVQENDLKKNVEWCHLAIHVSLMMTPYPAITE